MAEYYDTGSDQFSSDLRSRTLNTVCRVVIELDEPIYISTHKMNFDGIYYNPLLLQNPYINRSVDFMSKKFQISNVSLIISNIEQNGQRFSDLLLKKSFINTKTRIFFQSQTATTDDDTFEVYVGFISDIRQYKNTINLELEDYTQQKTNIKIPTQRVDSGTTALDRYRDKPIPIVYGHVDKSPTVIDNGIVKPDHTDVSLVTVGNSHEDYIEFGSMHNKYQVPYPFEHNIVSPIYIYSGSSYISIPKNIVTTFPETIHRLFPVAYNLNVEEGTLGGITDIELVATPSPGSLAGERQWETTGDIGGQIKMVTNVLSKKGVYQGILFYKANSVSCYKKDSYTLDYIGDVVDGFDNPDTFNELTSKKLLDDDYDYFDLSNPNANGFDVSDEWEYNIFDLYAEEGGTWVDELTGQLMSTWSLVTSGGLTHINQHLIKLKVDVSPKVNTLGYNSRIAINGVGLPQLSQNWLSRDHYMTVRANGTTASYPTGSMFFNFINSFNQVFTLDTDFSGGFLTGSLFSPGNGKWKDIFKFPDLVDDPTYYGYGTSAQGYNDLISIYNISVTNITTNEVVPYQAYISMLNWVAQGSIELYFGLSAELESIYTESAWYQYTMSLGGRWSEIDVETIADIEHAVEEYVYLNVDGRKDLLGNVMRNPIDIMKHIAVTESGVPDDDVDTNSYESAKGFQGDEMEFGFSVNDAIYSKDLLEDISKSTLCFPHFNRNGKLAFPFIKESYNYQDYLDAVLIKEFDVINYSFAKSSINEVYTSYDVSYKFDYHENKYNSRISDENIDPFTTIALSLTPSELDYYGYSYSDENILQFDSKYIRDSNSANILAHRLYNYYRNQHLVANIRLPLSYVGVDIGSVIRFDKVLDDTPAYGIDYTKVVNPTRFEETDILTDPFGGSLEIITYSDGQFYYPLFFVNSVKINYTHIEIEATQLHYFARQPNVNDLDNWAGEGLLSYGAHEIEEEEDVVETEEEVLVLEYPLPNVDSSINYSFNLIEDTTTENLSSWITPSAWGIESFNDLSPTDWTAFSPSEIREYKALHITLQSNSGAPTYLSLENISGTSNPSAFELGWVGIIEDESIFEQGSGINILSGDTNILNYGTGLQKAFELSGSVGDIIPIVEHLTFFSSLYINIHSQEFAIGDINNDGTLNILDIAALINILFDPNVTWESETQQNAADINGDGQVNILDVVMLVNVIMEE